MASIDLEKGDGDNGGGLDSPVPGSVQNLYRAICESGVLLLYYFLLMLYLVGFSKSWLHAALGIAVPATLYLLPLIVLLHDTTPGGHNDVRPSDEPGRWRGWKIHVLYYLFYTFYLVGFTEYWWRAALGIVMTTAFVLLSFILPRNYPDIKTMGGNYNDIKPHGGVAVPLENGGGGEDIHSAVPGFQNSDKVRKTQPNEEHLYLHLGRVSALILVLYYFLFMFYLVSISKYLLHAALGIAVSTAFLQLSFCQTGLL